MRGARQRSAAALERSLGARRRCLRFRPARVQVLRLSLGRHGLVEDDLGRLELGRQVTDLLDELFSGPLFSFSLPEFFLIYLRFLLNGFPFL